MHCLVTGASRGIGWAVAQKFADEGHDVTLVATNRELLEQRRNQLSASKGQHHDIWVLDFSKPDADFVPRGKVDIFVNAAALGPGHTLVGMPPKDVNNVVQVNFTSAILLTRAVVESMIKEGKGGNIIHITSLLGIVGMPNTSVYSATKAGLDGFVRSLARELGPEGIRVNTIAPAVTDTDMAVGAPDALLERNIIPGKIPTASIADAVLFLTKNKNITGQTLRVDNGYGV